MQISKGFEDFIVSSLGYDPTTGFVPPRPPKPNTDPPSISDMILLVESESTSSVQFGFTKATDPDTDDTLLIYRLYRASEESDLSTLATLAANGIEVDNGIDVSSLGDSGLDTGVTYDYNITVEDPDGNKALYSQTSIVLQEASVDNVQIKQSPGYQVQSDGTLQLSASIDATNVDDLSINWSSSNTEKATVDSNGLVTFVNTGEVTIRAESNFDPTVFDEVTFTIYELSAVSEERQFTTA